MDSLVSKLDIPYLNYATDSRFSGDIELFKDSDHLNSKGQLLFSGVFFKDLDSVMFVDNRTK
jgi:hypothetical protein